MVSSPGVSADYSKFERGFKSRGHDSGLEALNFRDSCSLTCFHFCPRLILLMNTSAGNIVYFKVGDTTT
jgi:hypothetical protein